VPHLLLLLLLEKTPMVGSWHCIQRNYTNVKELSLEVFIFESREPIGISKAQTSQFGPLEHGIFKNQYYLKDK
jgi:hypothetical protein